MRYSRVVIVVIDITMIVFKSTFPCLNRFDKSILEQNTSAVGCHTGHQPQLLLLKEPIISHSLKQQLVQTYL